MVQVAADRAGPHGPAGTWTVTRLRVTDIPFELADSEWYSPRQAESGSHCTDYESLAPGELDGYGIT